MDNETFVANGKVCTKQGFLEILKPEKNKGKAKEEEKTEKEEIQYQAKYKQHNQQSWYKHDEPG